MTTETTQAPVAIEAPPAAQEAPAPLDGGIHAEAQPEAPALPGWAPALGDIPFPEEQLRTGPPDFDATVAAIDTPAAHPSQYVLPDMMGPDGEVTADTVADLRGIQALLYHADLPVTEGNALMACIADEAKRSPGEMDDAAFELQARQTEGQLRQLYGDRYDGLHAKVQELFRGLDAKTNGQFGDFLGDNAHILLKPLPMSRLFQHVERMHLRRRA